MAHLSPGSYPMWQGKGYVWNVLLLNLLLLQLCKWLAGVMDIRIEVPTVWYHCEVFTLNRNNCLYLDYRPNSRRMWCHSYSKLLCTGGVFMKTIKWIYNSQYSITRTYVFIAKLYIFIPSYNYWGEICVFYDKYYIPN